MNFNLTLKSAIDKYKIFNIPYYQRSYVWGNKNDGRNLYKLIDDILSKYEKDPSSQYLIGTCAFCAAQVNDIVDGQQRITSLLLLLSAIVTKCSPEKINEHNKLLMYNDKFILQEESYLTEEIKHCLGLPNNFNSLNIYNVNISKTFDKIKAQINNGWNNYQTSWYDKLYDYVLNNVTFSCFEFSNTNEALKYFLDINSLSIELSQCDLFFAILSQSLRIVNNLHNIDTIKDKIYSLSKNRELNKDIEGYKLYENKTNKGIDNIIYIFLNTFYQHDPNIIFLNDVGIGKWLSLFKNEVFNDKLKAKEFVEKFIKYLEDFEKIYKTISNYDSSLNITSSIYTSWILLQYENYADLLKILLDLFKKRHNYINDGQTLYIPGTEELNFDEIEHIAKRINLTLISNYIKGSNKRLDGFISNISLDSSSAYTRTINDITSDIVIDYIFNLNYNDRKEVAKATKIKDDSRIIKVILALQTCFLNHVANPNKNFNEYLSYTLLGENFTIEHLYSIQEYINIERRSKWHEKNKFLDATDFDIERFKFENLSLLDKSTNSSISDDEINEKLPKYKLARRMCGSEWEYLVQSFISDSEFYNNEKIQNLNLPNRALQNIDQNTWELSPNNRSFNIKLTELVLNYIAQI